MILILFLAGTFAKQSGAHAESVHGVFASGQSYSGEYSISENVNPDGVKIFPLTIKLKIDSEENSLLYTYATDDIPSVEASGMGYLSIIVNSGGMEGSVTYNYVIIDHGILISIGIVRTTLHRGKVDSIDVQPNGDLQNDERNKYVRQILRFNPSRLREPSNAYSAATLLLLGKGKFMTQEDGVRVSVLCGSKEVSDDPILLEAIQKVIKSGKQEARNLGTSNEKIVVNEKAYFYNSPNFTDIAKSYVVIGDVVYLVKRSNNGRYWLTDYVSARGLKTEKWLRCEDIGYCH